jgi:hypothetical protein
VLPAIFLVHLAEEWFGGEGLPAWTASALGASIRPTRFLVINGLAWPLFALLTVLGILRRRLTWLPVALAVLMVVNAVLHALGTLATGRYSPGLVTGLLLYLPVGLVALGYGRRALPPAHFQRAVVAGVLVHAAVVAVAFFGPPS